MTHFVQRTYNPLCPSDLKDDINLNVTITTELIQIVYDGISESYFEFMSEPPAPEITELDNILAIFVCPTPPDPDTQVDEQEFDDTAPPDENTIWSSEQITNTFVNLSTEINGVLSITGGGDLTTDRSLSLVNDADTPGTNKVYGTTGAGVKGWKDDPTGIPGPTGLYDWHDEQEFGDGGTTGDKFLDLLQASFPSNESSVLMLGDGEIVHATIDTEGSTSEVAIVKIFKGATKGGGGKYAGGTQIGSDINKTTGSMSQPKTNLTGYTFTAGDRISVYLERNPNSLKSPTVKLFIRYN